MLKSFAKNFRKPQGIFSKKVLKRMNENHAHVTEWGISKMDLRPDDVILDVGCGGGMAISKMAKSGAEIYGVDYSETAVKEASKLNKDLIENKQVNISRADVSELAFANDTFTIVTAFETIYFWPDWRENFKEILRVLKPGGKFCVVLEIMKNAENNEEMRKKIDMRVPKDGEVAQIMGEAGFKDIKAYDQEYKSTMEYCIIGIKQFLV